MKKIVFDNPHRKKHFAFFNHMNHPHFNITANVEVTTLLSYAKAMELPLTYSLVYLLSKAANNINEFRWRIRDNEVVEHEKVHPSFTVPTNEADVFSFCTVTFNTSAPDFIADANISTYFEEILNQYNQIINQDLAIETGYSDIENQRRFWKIDGFAQVPCGGTHVRSTGEVGYVALKRDRPGKSIERIEIKLVDNI